MAYIRESPPPLGSFIQYIGSFRSLTLNLYHWEMDESVQRQISEIANNAISEINRISQLVRSTPSSSARPALPSGSESGPSSRHSLRCLLNELQLRFPTTQRSSASTSSNRGRSQRVGRPSNESVIKDIFIVGLPAVYSVRKRQQLAQKRSVSNAEIALLAGLRLRKVGMKKLFITGWKPSCLKTARVLSSNSWRTSPGR